MLDAHTTDNQLAFQFDRWGDISEDLRDYGLEGLDPTAHSPDTGVGRMEGASAWLYQTAHLEEAPSERGQ